MSEGFSSDRAFSGSSLAGRGALAPAVAGGSKRVLPQPRSRAKIWSVHCWTNDVTAAFNALIARIDLQVFLVSGKRAPHGEFFAYIHLPTVLEDNTVVMELESVGFKSPMVESGGIDHGKRWRQNVLKNILAYCDAENPIRYYAKPEMRHELKAHLDEAQSSMNDQQNSLRSMRETVGRPRGEDLLARHLHTWAETRQLPMLWTRRNRENPEADRAQCGAFRADFTYELADERVVLLEHDENAHRGYATDRETRRQVQMALGFGGRPVHFIRYNPNGGLSEEGSLALLLARLQAAMAADDAHFRHFLTMEYLLYPPIEGGDGGPVQTFRFKSVDAYERWAILRVAAAT